MTQTNKMQPSTDRREMQEHLVVGSVWQDNSDPRHIVRLDSLTNQGNTNGQLCEFATIAGEAGSKQELKTHRDNFINRFTWIAASEEEYRKTSKVA